MTSDSDTTSRSDPSEIYRMRRYERLSAQKELEATDGRFSTARGLVFLVALVLCWFVIVDGSLPWTWLLIPTGVFIALIVAHSRTVRRLEHARSAVAYYDRGLDRLDDRWQGVGASGERYRDADHPYSSDLDIFGTGALFQMICGSRTRIGEDTLADWLSASAPLTTIGERQDAIRELTNQIDFREELALLDAEVHDELNQNRLKEWVQAEAQPISKQRRIIASVLGVLAILTMIGWMSGFGLAPFLIVVLFEILFFATVLREIRHVATEADEAGSGLSILIQVLELLETQKFSSPALAKLRASLETEGHPPSWQIRRLRNIIQSLNNCLQNQFFAPVAFLLGLSVHVVHRAEQWRERIGPHIPDWLDAVGRIEALSSLSGYAFENPENTFPELIDEAKGPCLEGTEIGHPLIPADKVMCNDVRLDSEQRLIMVSGSNMSGKSTLLRTVGINTVLALCGAPVRATQLRISPLVVGTAMRVNDSLQQGASLFYSVISRIKSVVELAGTSPPLLFLLDEILQGTNSHDRRVGAEGIIRQVVEKGAIGLVTTHDLALTEIVDSFDGIASNIHFEDHLINGRMYFDYRIRFGVVRKSNALELMRMIGLEVGDEPDNAEQQRD